MAGKPLQASIVGTGSSLPQMVLSNKELETIVDTTDEWITRRTGIKERRIASKHREETSTDLATQAALKALDMAGMGPNQLDMIVVGTVTPDRQFPSTACMLQKTLNADRIAAFDVSAGCSGFLYALSIVNDAIRAGSCKTALVLGVERLSTIVDWQDRGTCVLLGDGAGAVVVTASSDGRGILSTHLRADGSLWDLLYAQYGHEYLPEVLQDVDIKPFHLRMEGNRLFKRAIGCLSSIATEALEHNSLTSEDIALVVPHQANLRIVQAMAGNLNFPMEKVFTNVHKYGNTSSASIPIALDEANRQGLLKKDDRALLVAFGAGLTWGSSIVTWSI
ncbi:MAG: ketoacyl-ACP synthase III [Deltaproteobacteria bacterium]|nr:ketoacyl-ACP synthase III [Deltaproteobacteria bacterium]